MASISGALAVIVLMYDWYKTDDYKSQILRFTDNEWAKVSESNRLTNILAEEFPHKIVWRFVSEQKDLSEDFIERYSDKLDWGYISRFQKLSEDFIRRHSHEVDWLYIFRYQRLTEDFILSKINETKIDWDVISISQKLSDSFIIRYKDNLNWKYVTRHQDISPLLLKDFRVYIDWIEYINKYGLSSDLMGSYGAYVIAALFKSEELLKTYRASY